MPLLHLDFVFPFQARDDHCLGLIAWSMLSQRPKYGIYISNRKMVALAHRSTFSLQHLGYTLIQLAAWLCLQRDLPT
jgi:hypothetical protein